MTRLYLMRHGEAELADHQQGQAGGEDPEHLFSVGNEGLSVTGRAQAANAAGLLSDTQVDAIYASPLNRCQETAELVAAPLGLSVTTVDELAEVPFSKPGASYEDVLARIVSLAVELKEGKDPALAGGRTYSEIKQAFAEAVEEIVEAHEAPLVVAHGAQNRIYLAELLGMPSHRLFSIEQDHACINVVGFGEQPRVVVEKLNVTREPLVTEGASSAGEG